jgi:hypothetical protein
MGKTKQASVRFDPVKLELLKRREKLETPQKVVDFLMDAYYWQNKLTVAPQLNALGQTLPYIAPVAHKTPYENYEQEITNAGSLDELERTGRHLENDRAISPGDKLKLHDIAKKKAELFT